MYEIDKEKFGAFVASCRKEKGMTQQELADKLFLSNKAVSKWETGNSIPDVALLIPLSEVLGVSVMELLECRRMEPVASLSTEQADTLVKKVIGLSGREQIKAAPGRGKRALLLMGCTLVSILEAAVVMLMELPGNTQFLNGMMLVMASMLTVGVYYYIFAKQRVPAYYDENKISVYSDGMVRINFPGVHINNRNWHYIIRSMRITTAAMLMGYPLLCLLCMVWLPKIWQAWSVYISLAAILGGLFIPVYVVGRKYK